MDRFLLDRRALLAASAAAAGLASLPRPAPAAPAGAHGSLTVAPLPHLAPAAGPRRAPR